MRSLYKIDGLIHKYKIINEYDKFLNKYLGYKFDLILFTMHDLIMKTRRYIRLLRSFVVNCKSDRDEYIDTIDCLGNAKKCSKITLDNVLEVISCF